MEKTGIIILLFLSFYFVEGCESAGPKITKEEAAEIGVVEILSTSHINHRSGEPTKSETIIC